MIAETSSESDAADQAAPAKAIDPKRRYLCRHIHASGHRCSSPALRGANLCFYHRASHQGPPISVGRTPATAIFEMPQFDDRPGIQLALYNILARVASCDIDTKRAGLLLYGLQIASANLPRHAQSDTALQPQVDEVIYDHQLGELAPITEIPTPTSVPTSGAPCSTASSSTMGLQPTDSVPPIEAIPTTEAAQPTEAVISSGAVPPTEVVLLSGAKNPLISPEPPQQSTAQQPAPDPPPAALAAGRLLPPQQPEWALPRQVAPELLAQMVVVGGVATA